MISISEHIYEMLSGSEELKKMVEGKIYAISTKESTSFPFLAYSRTSLVAEYTKDNHTNDIVTVEVLVLSDDYKESVVIAEATRRALEGKRVKYKDFTVMSARVKDSTEHFISDTFVQSIEFIFTTFKNLEYGS